MKKIFSILAALCLVAGIAGWMMLGEAMSWHSWLAMLVTLTGIGYSILNRGGESHKLTLQLPLKGVLLGMGAAILYSGDVIINKKVKGVAGIDRTIIQMGFAALAILPYWLANEDFSTLTFSLQPMLLLMVTAVVCTALTYSLYFSAIQKVPAQTAAILSYIDPVVAVLISALILNEGMSVLTLIGVVLVIGAALCSDTGSSKD